MFRLMDEGGQIVGEGGGADEKKGEIAERWNVENEDVKRYCQMGYWGNIFRVVD